MRSMICTRIKGIKGGQTSEAKISGYNVKNNRLNKWQLSEEAATTDETHFLFSWKGRYSTGSALELSRQK